MKKSYRLYTEGVSNKRQVKDSEDIHVVEREAYSSLFSYKINIKEHIRKEGSVSGYDKETFGKFFVLDLDSENLEKLILRMKKFLEYLKNNKIDYYLFFSGNKGFHIYIPKEYIDYNHSLDNRWNVASHLFATKIKEMFPELENDVDLAIYDKVRIFRLPFSIHPKTGRRKSLLIYNGIKEDDPWKSFTKSSFKKEAILSDVLNGRTIPISTDKKYFELDNPKKHKEVDANKGDVRRYCDFPYGEKLCIYKMLNNFDLKGERHKVALRLQSYWTEKGYTKDYVEQLLKAWNNRLNDKLSNKEIQNILKYYEKRYTFTCEDSIKRKYCVPSCHMFKSKDIKDTYIHIGKKYRERYLKELHASKDLWIDLQDMFPEWNCPPIKPGYTTIIAGGPGSGKTTLMLNIMRFFDHINWLFFSIEMKGTHITDKWIKMMGYDLDKEEDAMKLDYQMKTKITLDKPNIRVSELRDYVSLIRSKTGVQPNAIVIDYLGLLNAKGSGATERMITVSKELKNIAKDMNLMIFGISQVPKKIAGDSDVRLGLDAPKDSGEIVNLADMVFTVWRPYSQSKYQDDNIISLGVPKNRHGPKGYVKNFRFFGERYRIESAMSKEDGEQKSMDI